MVRATGIVAADRRYSKVLQGSDPLCEDRRDGDVLLRIYTTHAASTVVQIVVGIQRLPLFRGLQRTLGTTHIRHRRVCLRLLLFKLAKVLLYISTRTKQTLLLTAPQGNADRAAWLHTNRLQNTNCLHCDDRACTVVRRPRSADPAIQMPANHNNLVLQPRIRSGNLSHRIEAMLV